MMQTKSHILTHTWALALGALVCCILWGSAFPGVKIGYTLLSIPAGDWAAQMVFAGSRFMLAGGMVIAAGSLSARRFLHPTRKSLPKVICLSLFQTMLQYFFYYIGLAHTTGVNAAVIVAANVFFAILFSVFVFRLERMSVRKICGCLVGFAGVVTVHLSSFGAGVHLNLLGDGFILLCTVASGVSSVLMKRYSAAGESPMMLSGWQFLAGGAVMWLAGTVCGGTLASANFVKMLLIDRTGVMVSLVVCLTLLCAVLMAKLVGCILPMVAKRIGFDPAVLASPFITTIVDALSLLVYFGIASSILGL